MDILQKLKLTIQDYLQEYPHEKSKLSLLLTQLSNNDDLFNRKNFTGHITASGIILSSDKSNVLLIFHKKLNKYLQPGGHFEKGDTLPLDICKREIMEETGLDNLYQLDFSGKLLPIDIDTHYIPENIKKNEPSHYHHDFRYVFIAKSMDINIQREEVRDYKWMSVDEAVKIDSFEHLFSKIKSKSEQDKPVVFFQNINENTQYVSDINFIVVTHILPDRPNLLRALSNIGKIDCIIPKPNSINKESYESLSKHYDMVHLTKEELADASCIQARIKKINGRIIILDIGGYFANCINQLTELFPGKIIGVVEDTENGHQKYNSIKNLTVPVVSVARSPLKLNEDNLVGQSVVFSTDYLLRENNFLINFMKAGILGYGKIGSSIANYLLQNNISCNVFDTDPIKRIEAMNKGCLSSEKSDILKNSDIIFCATGNSSLNEADFRLLKNGVFIVSVTSSDDEMEIKNIYKEYKKVKITKYIDKYSNEFNYFYLLNQGNAVNFINNAVVGNFIYLVQGEILSGVEYLLNKKLKNILSELPIDYRTILATKWLKVFNK